MAARLPIATLARASGGRRRGGKRRLFLTLFALVLVAAGGIWYARHRDAVPETLPALPAMDEPIAGATGVEETPPPDATPPLTFGSAPSPTESATPASRTTADTGVRAKPTSPDAQPEAPAPAEPQPAPIEKDFRPRLPRDVFEAQVALMRDAICPGSIDGAWGGQTSKAVAAFQRKHGLRVTGQLDNPTREALKLRVQPLRHYTVTAEDIARLRPWPKGWVARSELDFMGYSTVLEAVAERSCTHPNQIKRLNPNVDWSAVKAGTTLVLPNIGTRAGPSARPEYIQISLSAKTLQVLDGEERLLAHFPCSIARRVEKRPVGELTVLTVAPNPNYTFKPETFPDSAEAQKVGRNLILQPGPNNPVGTAWIALSAGDGSYGIHGSPEPEQIGRTESSGCFRLANWNAEYLAPLARSGMLVRVEP